MLRTGILHPQLNSLLSRVRHTNTLVIADRGFPFWPLLEIVDLAVLHNIKKLMDLLRAILPNFVVGQAWMAEEFRRENGPATVAAFEGLLPQLIFEPHADFKKRVPMTLGLVRTGDTTQYANVILESA